MEGRRVGRSLCLLADINCRRKEIDKLCELCSESGFLADPSTWLSGHALRLAPVIPSFGVALTVSNRTTIVKNK
jgi:hypothetical protein